MAGDEKEPRLLERLDDAHRMEAVGALAGGIAHDFNNILNVILGHTDLALGKQPGESPLRRHLLEIREAAERAAHLTRQLLAFSRRQILQPRPLDLHVTLREALPVVGRLAGEAVTLSLDLAPSLPLVAADPVQLRQVLANLAANARDAMPEGGRLTIETAAEPVGAGHWSGLTPGSYVRLSLTDSGPGIPAELRERVFEPFFTTRHEGAGLGLSTVYGIVRQSLGAVRVRPGSTLGACFDVLLPSATGEAVQPAAASPARAAHGERLLLVEDDAALRSLAAEVLSEAGYRVSMAHDGPSALELAGRLEDPIELLVTDVVMPGMTGIELARLLDAARPGLRTLFLSGYTEDVTSRHGALDPGVRFLAKPYSASDLLREVREGLDSPPGHIPPG